MAERWPHSGSIRSRNLPHRRGQPRGTLKWGSLDSSDVEATEYKTCPVQLWYYTLRAVATVYHTVRCSRTTNRGKKKKKVVVFYNGGILTKVTNVRVYLPSFIFFFLVLYIFRCPYEVYTPRVEYCPCVSYEIARLTSPRIFASEALGRMLWQIAVRSQ